MEERKTKPTNKQLQRRIEKSPLHLDLTKSTKSIFFSDKGVRLTIDDDYAIVAFGYSQTVFSNYNISGISRPWLYVKRVIEIADENAKAMKTDTGYSFALLLATLKEKEDNAEYNIITYFAWWLTNLFSPQFSIGETDIESFLVYEDYIHNIARNAILLDQRNEDMTNQQFIDRLIGHIKEFTADIQESIILHKKTDEQIMSENIAAEQEQTMEAQINGSQD